MSNRVVIRNGKPGFIINGKFVAIPDGDNVNTTSPRIPRDDMSGLEAIGSVLKNTVTGKGAAGIRQDATKPNPNYGGRPKVTQDPDEYFGTGDYGSGGPKEKPKQKFPDLRGGDAKVDGDGNPKVDYTKPQTQSIPTEPYTPPTTTTTSRAIRMWMSMWMHHIIRPNDTGESSTYSWVVKHILNFWYSRQ